jgi:hypothetical protein
MYGYRGILNFNKILRILLVTLVKILMFRLIRHIINI